MSKEQQRKGKQKKRMPGAEALRKKAQALEVVAGPYAMILWSQ
jgi:hypothetical protein